MKLLKKDIIELIKSFIMKDIEIDKFSDTFQNIVVKRRKEQIEYYFDEKRVREKITQIYIQLTKT